MTILFFYVEGTIRRDRTSTMHPDNNSFVYPSINSSLVFSQNGQCLHSWIMENSRASWGIVGNYPVFMMHRAYLQGTRAARFRR
ncbi:MAG: hypothetical protein IPH28_19950 [Cytophagaceae bacterium]|nr:hypothetical protein [Cytophagaceae bacterium]